MFGTHDIPLALEQDGISLSVQKDKGVFYYERDCLGETKKKILLIQGTPKILINPVEPLNRPKALTHFLYVGFEKGLLLGPKAEKTIFTTFPVEIGLYGSAGRNFEVLDIFTLTKTKYTVYGNPAHGVLCKYWPTEVHATMPSVNPLEKGILALRVSNTGPDWLEVNKAVFNAYGMKIYYNDKKVCLNGTLKLRAGNIAETDFEDRPLEAGMTKAFELYLSRRLTVSSTKFVMEFGL
jgi:hypothetical protein